MKNELEAKQENKNIVNTVVWNNELHKQYIITYKSSF